MDNAASAIWRILATDWQKCGYTGSSKAERRFLRFICTKNNRAPDGEDRYAVRSTCFLAEDRNTIVLQEDGFIAAGRISAQCDMDAQVKELIQSRVAKI